MLRLSKRMTRKTHTCFVLMALTLTGLLPLKGGFMNEGKDVPCAVVVPDDGGELCQAKPKKGAKAKKKKGGRWAIVPDPKLPNVLILGDSISLGYTLGVRKLLAGKANVFRPSENCAGTTNGIKRIDDWLKGHKWSVIHFNWGLHDLKHVDGKTGKNSNSFDDPQQASPEKYKENLTKLVAKLKATGAKLIFATTTPYPDGVKPARLPADAKKYNDIAIAVAKANGVKINDLYSFVLPKLKELQRPKNVHFGPKGSQALAEKVAEAIGAELK